MRKNDPLFWSDKKVFVTGGTGFIGSHLVKKLQELGAEVRVFVHKKPSKLQGFCGDLSNIAVELRTYLSVYKPDVVFHLAAEPLINYAKERILETLETNVRGTYNLLYACNGVSSIQSIVHISTDKVYGNIPVITDEAVPMGIEHPYNASKLSADVLAQMYANTFGLPITIIRNGNIYGEGDHHFERIVPRTIARVFKGLPPIIRGDGKSLRDYVHVSDIVSGFINSAEYGWGRSDILRLGSQRAYAVSEVVDTILKVCKRVDLAPQYQDMLQDEIPNQHIQDPKSAEKIGWLPEVSFEDGMERAVAYYRKVVEENETDSLRL